MPPIEPNADEESVGLVHDIGEFAKAVEAMSIMLMQALQKGTSNQARSAWQMMVRSNRELGQLIKDLRREWTV